MKVKLLLRTSRTAGADSKVPMVHCTQTHIIVRIPGTYRRAHATLTDTIPGSLNWWRIYYTRNQGDSEIYSDLSVN